MFFLDKSERNNREALKPSGLGRVVAVRVQDGVAADTGAEKAGDTA